jgi:hypothetical protein
MGKGNRECSPFAKQLFGTDMAGVMESAPHPLYFHLLEHLNDGEYSPSIMFPSLPSICNDRELIFVLISFRSICNDREYFLSKNLHFPLSAA